MNLNKYIQEMEEQYKTKDKVVYDINYNQHKNFIVRWFFKSKYKIALNMVFLKHDDLVLDFGCDGKWLKDFLNCNYIGYDINPEQTEIKDYTKLKPNVIFAFDVFEHIEKTELRKIIRIFKKMNPEFILVTIIPKDNWLDRKGRNILLGLPENIEDHITSYDEIYDILNSELKCIKTKCFLGITLISKWENKKEIEK